MRWVQTAGAVLLAASLALPAAASAADRDGVIVDVNGKARVFTVRTVERERAVVETFRTDEATRITFERKRVPFGNLVPGGHVSVRYENRDVGPLATSIIIHRLRGR